MTDFVIEQSDKYNIKELKWQNLEKSNINY
jgi:hypothetical protein